MAMNDSVTLTGDNAETIEGGLKDRVRFTVVGTITRMAIEPNYNTPVESGSSEKKPKKESSVTISEIEVEDCEMADESDGEDEDQTEDKSGMPKAVKIMAAKM